MFQFSYFLASYSKFRFASFGIVSGVPFLGFGPLPGYRAPIIDLHGLRDTVIPYSAASHGSYGAGPRGEVATVVSYDGMFYLEKPAYVQYLGLISVFCRAANDSLVLTNTEKAPTRAFSWLKAPTSAFTFKTVRR